MLGVISILFFIQFWRRPPCAGCRCSTGGLDAGKAVFAAQKVVFGVEMEPAGMLARKVQATAITDRVAWGGDGVNGGVMD